MPPSSTASSYVPLASPLPSHPGLSTTKSSHAIPLAAPPIVSAGALSAISALLGASRARETASPRSPGETGRPRRSSLLARRRGDTGAADFSLGPELRLSFPHQRAEEQPPRRVRERTRDPGSLGEDLPPSPVGLPGGWHDSQTATSALLLPPPFLDQTSSAESFEGELLSTRKGGQLG